MQTKQIKVLVYNIPNAKRLVNQAKSANTPVGLTEALSRMRAAMRAEAASFATEVPGVEPGPKSPGGWRRLAR